MPETADSSNAYGHIGILGAGAWGVALAHVAVRAGRSVTLWSRHALATHADLRPPEGVNATLDRDAAARADAILLVVPAQHVREVFTAPAG